MAKTTLFVCQSCHSSNSRPPEQPADGQVLCDLIQKLHQNSSRSSELDVCGVDCLWTCDHPCAIAFSSPGKPTYVLAKILVKDSNHGEIAKAVLQLSEGHLDSKKGNIPWKQFPEALKTDFIARIPPSGFNGSDKTS